MLLQLLNVSNKEHGPREEISSGGDRREEQPLWVTHNGCSSKIQTDTIVLLFSTN